MQSPIYWHPFLYQSAIRFTYGKHYISRYKQLEKHIPKHADLLELCMGDCFFYLNFLRQKQINYKCADINEVFVKAAKQKQIEAFQLNIFTDDIPTCDYILLQGSLSYFIPHEKQIIQKLLVACRKQLIISENIHNLSNSRSPIKSWIGEKFSAPDFGQSKIKFTKETLTKTFSDFKSRIVCWEESPDNKEIIIVLNAN